AAVALDAIARRKIGDAVRPHDLPIRAGQNFSLQPRTVDPAAEDVDHAPLAIGRLPEMPDVGELGVDGEDRCLGNHDQCSLLAPLRLRSHLLTSRRALARTIVASLPMPNTREVFLCDAVRTPIGRYGGALAKVRTDDLAAIPIRALIKRHPNIDGSALDEVVLGCANQAGEDNRNVARMAVLLAGLPDSVPGLTVNRLCASGLNAIGDAARAIRSGEMDFAVAGGGDAMTRAPFVMGKAAEAFQRSNEVFDTTIGWRFVNPLMKQQYGVDSMPETGENVAEEFQVARKDQDAFALRSQQRAGKAIAAGYF